jgi:hypothetical protein
MVIGKGDCRIGRRKGKSRTTIAMGKDEIDVRIEEHQR